MYKKLLICFLLMISNFCIAQGYDFIFGQLVDSTQNEPIAFATIRVKNKAKGVITNVDGTFKIPLRFKTIGEVLEISCLGFITKDILIKDMVEGQGNNIVLKPSAFELSEAVVSANIKKLSAQQIVRIAVNSIPQNYPIDRFGVIGYYRDYQVKNRNYTNLSEAIIKVADQGFGKKNILTNQYQLYSYNPNTDFEIDSFARQPYDYEEYNKVVPNAKMKNEGGNEFITLRMHDAIRNYGLESFSFVDDLSSDFTDNHKFRLKGKTNYGKESVYEIDMVYRNKDYVADGAIFINTNDFAIHKLDYAVFKRKKPNDVSGAINDEERFSDGFKKMNREMLYHIQIEYVRGAKKKMFLNYISFYNKVLVHRPAPFKSKFVVNLNDKSFRIRMNKIPAERNKIKIRDFDITYKNTELPIKEFYFLEDERTFVVCPYLRKEGLKETMALIFKENDSLRIPDLKYAYGNIKDNLGNKLDDRKWEYLHQYREFFTQEVKSISNEKLKGNKLMIKDLPLESELQPIYEDGMKKEYWKNTPLPMLKN